MKAASYRVVSLALTDSERDALRSVMAKLEFMDRNESILDAQQAAVVHELLIVLDS